MKIEGLFRLGMFSTIQNSRDKLMGLPVFKRTTIKTGLFSHFQRRHLAVCDTFLLTAIGESN